MNETKHYTVICPTGLRLPNREDFFELGFGSLSSTLPISHVQDAEDLNLATYLDFKIDKWRIDARWRQEQQSEPMIRLEFLREHKFVEYLQANLGTAFVAGLSPLESWAITMELDGDDIHRLDYVSLKCLVCGLIELGATKVVEDNGSELSTAALSGETKNLRDTLADLAF